MSRKMRTFFCVAGILVLTLGAMMAFVQHQNIKNQTILDMTSEQKLSDFDTLCSVLDESYPFWNEVAQSGIDKNEIYRTYRDNVVNTKTDIAFFKEISYFLKEFGGFGHLSALDGHMYRLYMNALSASGSTLSEQEKRNIQPLIEVLTNAVSQKTYEFLDQSHEGFRSISGLKEEYQNQSTPANTQALPQLVTKFYDSPNAAYLKIDSFDLMNYKRDQGFLSEFYMSLKDIPYLIIDLRENSGGSDLYWQDLIVKPNVKESVTSERYYFFNLSGSNQNYISANGIYFEPISAVREPYLSHYGHLFSHYTVDKLSFDMADEPYQGEIWVLVSDEVYSASENFAMFCKNTGFATLVGTATGGDGGIADPMLISLPNSGLIVRFSAFYGTNADGSGNEANGTAPDIMIADGEDALEKCLELLS